MMLQIRPSTYISSNKLYLSMYCIMLCYILSAIITRIMVNNDFHEEDGDNYLDDFNDGNGTDIYMTYEQVMTLRY